MTSRRPTTPRPLTAAPCILEPTVLAARVAALAAWDAGAAMARAAAAPEPRPLAIRLPLAAQHRSRPSRGLCRARRGRPFFVRAALGLRGETDFPVRDGLSRLGARQHPDMPSLEEFSGSPAARPQRPSVGAMGHARAAARHTAATAPRRSDSAAAANSEMM